MLSTALKESLIQIMMAWKSVARYKSQRDKVTSPDFPPFHENFSRSHRKWFLVGSLDFKANLEASKLFFQHLATVLVNHYSRGA